MAQIASVFATAGQGKVVDLLTTDNTLRHVGWGSGTTAPTVGDTGLETALAEARTAGTISQPTATTHRVVATITATDTRSVSEVGLFDASTSGNLIVRATHTTRSLVAGDEVRYTIDLPVQDSSQ